MYTQGSGAGTGAGAALRVRLMGRTGPRAPPAKQGYLQPEQEEGRGGRTPKGCLPTHLREQRGATRGLPMPDPRSYLGQGQIQLQLPQTGKPKLGLEPSSPESQELTKSG